MKKKDKGLPLMETPLSRIEFEHNLNLVLEQSNNIMNASDSSIGSFLKFTFPELKKLKKLPNGRLNLLTISESLRLNANTQNYMMKLGPLEIDETEE